MTSPKPLKFEKKSHDHETIFLNHYDWLLDWARQHTQGASEEAEDLVQDLYVRFVQMKSGPAFTDDDQIPTSPPAALHTLLECEPGAGAGKDGVGNGFLCWSEWPAAYSDAAAISREPEPKLLDRHIHAGGRDVELSSSSGQISALGSARTPCANVLYLVALSELRLDASSLPLTRGNSDFDVRHNLEAGASWEMQSISGGKALEVLTERWALDGRLIARTAFPMTLQGNLLTDPATGNLYFNNVNLVPGVPIYLYQPQYPGDRIVNAAAFRTPTGISPGNAPRNFVRGFNAVQINLAARREFQLYERLHLQFRAEAFNILNHPNFGYVDPVLSDATFGQATKMLNQSLTTVSSQYRQGGPFNPVTV